ncbi:MAG: hypothetical protein M3426_12785 [Actinomycetota bacterium]|jgi:hypothetical protein|nr:hypothetical protein [Actinomycetota bacterium]
MSDEKVHGTRWSAVSMGWAVAVVAGLVMSPLLRTLYTALSEPPGEPGDLTVTVVVISLLAGFLSYLIGGYVAARMAVARAASTGH